MLCRSCFTVVHPKNTAAKWHNIMEVSSFTSEMRQNSDGYASEMRQNIDSYASDFLQKLILSL